MRPASVNEPIRLIDYAAARRDARPPAHRRFCGVSGEFWEFWEFWEYWEFWEFWEYWEYWEYWEFWEFWERYLFSALST